MIGIYIVAITGVLFFTIIFTTSEVALRPLYGDSNDSWLGAAIRWIVICTIMAVFIINYTMF